MRRPQVYNSRPPFIMWRLLVNTLLEQRLLHPGMRYHLAIIHIMSACEVQSQAGWQGLCFFFISYTLFCIICILVNSWWHLLILGKLAARAYVNSSCDCLFLARDTAFFLTTGSCVSELPTKVFLCVRIRDTLNLFLEWGNPFKKWPHFKQKIGHRLPYINYLYKGLHHTGM